MRWTGGWLGLLLAVSGLAAQPAPPTVAVGSATGDLQIDGQFDEPAWAAVGWSTGFVNAGTSEEAGGGTRLAAVQTRFKVLHDAEAIYLAVECDEPSPESIRANYRQHDSDVYQDDCVEIFLDPAGEGRYYHHFVINTTGAWYDDYNADYGLVHGKLWDAPLTTAAVVDAAAKVWRAEVRIPLAALQLHDDAGASWRWNVTRERYAGGSQELSTWSPLQGNFHTPRRFGTLTGLDLDYTRFAIELDEPRLSVSGRASGARSVRLETRAVNHTGAALIAHVTAGIFGHPDTSVSSGALALEPGGSAEVSLPVLVVPHLLRNEPLQLTVVDQATGQARKIVVKRLDTEYRPLTIDLLEPVYRGNIYATETVSRLVYRLTLADDVAARTARVTVRLAGAEGQAVAAAEIAAAALAGDQSLDIATLAEGTWQLEARALAAGGEELASQRVTLRKLPRPVGNEVRIDAAGNILINGEPRTFIGWYGKVPLNDPRPEVVALQNVQTPVVLAGLDPTPIREAWERHGIYTVLDVEPGRLYHTFELWRQPGHPILSEPKTLSEPSESTRDMVRQLVEAVRDEPGLLGYYLADEPEISDTRSDYLEAFYALLQELDPYHPVMITNDTLDGIVTHGYKACDILNPDPYSPAWDYVPNFMKKAAGTGARGKALMTTLWHAAGHGNFNMPWGSAPPYPYRVMRSQYLASVALGSRGFTAYIDPFFLAEPVLRWGLPPIWREVRFLEPAMAQPAEPVTVTASAEAAVWLRRVAGQAYLIVVNHKPGERAIAVQSPALQGVERLLVVGEGREVVLRDGGFTETFAEGDARIYTTDPAGRELALTAEVERDIAAHEAAAIAPGNLLHLSRGVRAKASGGFYAPWLEQFYYYAINGLRDDLGWYLTHAGGQPASLELTLPEAAGIGQVVVYTPNLADFDLQFTGPDGAIRVAEVRQNAEDPVRVRFDPPLPTLKLRLTALAVRDGASPQAAQVPEIEAYAEAGEGPVTPVREEAGAVAPDFVAPARETAGPLTLWREDFTAFEHRDAFRWDGTDPWVFNPTTLRTEPQPGGGLKLIGLGRGTPSMARYWPYESDYRWFQVDLAAIEGGGYQFTTVNLTDGSGQPGFRVALNTSRPGLYTIDTWAQHPSFADGSLTQCFTPVYTVGGGLDAAEQPLPGTQFTYRLLQLARRPVNGLTVTMADGAPLPDTLRPGDELLFRVLLDEPAADATVEVLTGSSYQSLRLTDQPGIQLARVGDRDGREWAAQVRLADDVGKYDGRQGYPVLFHAALTGGPLAETWSAAQVRFGE